MRDPKILDDSVSLLRSLMGPILEANQLHPDEWSFAKLECELLKVLMTLGAFFLARICGARNGYQGTSVPGHRDVGEGTHHLEHKGQKKRWVVTLFGRIFYGRAYYRNKTFKDSRWPRDEELGLAPNELLSPGVLEKAAQERIEEVFERRAPQPEQETSSRTIGPPDAVMVHCDGITVPHCAGGDMEIKVARIDRAALQSPPRGSTRKRTVKPRQGRKAPRAEGEKRQQELADLKESREQREYKDASKLVEECVREAAPELGVELTALVLFLADGGRWCWEVCETHFPKAVQILDIFHLARHIIETANALWGTRSGEAKRWRKRLLLAILRGELSDVICELEGLCFVDEPRNKARKALLTYLHNNRGRMDYPRYIEAGYPISSAMAEGACRHVIGGRPAKSIEGVGLGRIGYRVRPGGNV